MNLAAVEDMEARFPDTDVVLIESGGDNLTLTFSPALVDYFIYVIDVAAGDKIPRKNGPGISQSDILVINKTDLAPYVDADLERHGPRRATDARRQAGRLHQLQDRRGHRRTGRADPRATPCSTLEVVGVITDWTTARELAPYQDEPAQLPERRRSARSACCGCGFERRGDRTILADLYRQCAAARAAGALLGRGDAGAALRLRSSPPPAASSRATGYAIDIDWRRGAWHTSPPRRPPRSTRWTRTTARRPSSVPRRRRLPGVPARAGDPVPRSSRSSPDTRVRLHPTATLLYAEILHAGPEVLPRRRDLRLRPLLLDAARGAARRAAAVRREVPDRARTARCGPARRHGRFPRLRQRRAAHAAGAAPPASSTGSTPSGTRHTAAPAAQPAAQRRRPDLQGARHGDRAGTRRGARLLRGRPRGGVGRAVPRPFAWR